MILAPIAVALSAALFAPPEGVPIRVVTELTDSDRHFRMERLVRFTREGNGWRAEVRVLAAVAEGPAQASGMMAAGYSGLIGRSLVFHLDANAAVTAVDGQQAVWTGFCDGIVAILRVRRANADSLAGPLRALPPERQRAVLGTLVTALIADEADEPSGIRAVRLPGGSPFGSAVTLEGMRSISRTDSALHSATQAAGATGDGRIELDIAREIDPRTGMLVGAEESTVTTSGTGADARRIARRSTVQVTIEPATAWP